VSLPVAILAGGRATRLGELARDTPKSLIEVAGKPFAAHQLELLKSRGVTDVVFCLGHLGERVQGVIGDGSAFGIRVRYSCDGERLLGTGGALRKAMPLLGEAFHVLYGDSYLECDYQAVASAFKASGLDGLMTVVRNDDRWDRSNIVLRDGRIVRYDKANRTPEMRHIDYGLGVLNARALARYPVDHALDLVTVYQDLIADGGLAACEVHARFYEIGGVEGLAETRQHLSASLGSSPARRHLDETAQIVAALDPCVIDRMAGMLAALRERGGRLFFLGVGGSAANCSHAVNDFRKIARIEAYTPVDNVSELTARTNDEGWESVFVEWLKGSRLKQEDMVFVFSVGGGSLEKNISPNLVRALEYARQVGARILGVVGRDGGYTATVADACVIIPTVNPDTVTPHAEAFQSIIWHLLVSHPIVKAAQTKWESAR
jgi:D-sedoheptulose 7-phosphate isomerase